MFGQDYRIGKKKAKEIIKKVIDKGKESFEVEVFRILEFYGVDIPEYQVARSKSDIYYIIDDMGLPVVIKALASQAVHREDLEAVIVVRDKKDVESAYPKALGEIASNLPWLTLEGILVQKYVAHSEKVTFILERENKKDKGSVSVNGQNPIKLEDFDLSLYPFVEPVMAFFKDFNENIRMLEIDFVKATDEDRWFLVDGKCYLFY